MKSENPAISVILPTYNVSKYISYCIDSILGQTFQDFELLIVDDVSTDDTYEICKKICGNMDGVSLIRNKSNMGQWYARNMGISNAKGKYIYFIDNDDEMLPWALEYMYKTAEEEQADVVHTNLWYSVYSEDRMISRSHLWKPLRCVDIEAGELQEKNPVEIVNYQAAKSMPMPWLNLYRRKFLEEEGIRFPEMTFSEDNSFSIEVCLKAKKYVRINELLYLYRYYFDMKSKLLRRFPKVFLYVPIILREYKRIFSRYTELEFPYKCRREIISGILMTYISSCVYEFMDLADEKDFSIIKQEVRSLCGEGEEFAAYLLYAWQYSEEYQSRIISTRKKKIARAHKLFAHLENSKSISRNYSYCYNEAKLATYIDGADEAFYCKAHECLADAALELVKYQEAREAYSKALTYAQPGSEAFLRIAGKRLVLMDWLEGLEDEKAEKIKPYVEALAGIVPYVHSRRRKSGGRKKIRIGLLSDCFYGHDMFLLRNALLFRYDREQFEVICYHCGTKEDDYTKAVREQVQEFVEVSKLSYKERAKIIYEDEIDVLVDLAGRHWEETVPVFAYRPAPVQIAEAGRLPLVKFDLYDYYLVDDMTAASEGYSGIERKLLYMPCCISYAMRNDAEILDTLPLAVNNHITFGAILHYWQISDEVVALWREIMERVPEAILLLKADEFEEKAMMVEAAERFEAAGLDLGRVRCQGISADCLADYRDMDVFLGTLPIQDEVRLLNAIYMGVPAVIGGGAGYHKHICMNVLSKLGLSDFVASTQAEYVEKAVALAGDLGKINDLHKTLRNRITADSSFSPTMYMKAMEKVLRRLHIAGRF